MSTYLEYIHPYTYTSIHFPWAYIVYKFLKSLPCLFFQNMGLKETQEFPSPEQFVRNNYGKFTHHTEPNIPNDQTVTNQSQSNKSHRAKHSKCSNSNKSWSGEGDGEASDAEAMNQLASVVGGFVQVGQCLLFHFFCISIYLLFWRKSSVCWVDLSAIFGALLIKYFHIMGAFDLWWFKDWQRTYLQQISNQFQTMKNYF